MTIYRMSGVVVGIVCLLLVATLLYGFYSDCPDTAGYVFCEHQ